MGKQSDDGDDGDSPMTAIPHELTWFPCYPDKILSSVQWMRMTDFQRGWYWQILLKMTRSKPIGYLRLDDGQLWMLAGAHSRQYWDTHAALVLACFKVAEFDGHRWIYNQKLLDVLREQEGKHAKAVQRGKSKKNLSSASSSSSTSYSREFEEVWENSVWEKVSKKTAGVAFEKAVQGLLALAPWPLAEPAATGKSAGATETKSQEPKAKSRNDAASFIAQAMEQFKNSDAGKANGLFDDYQPPYPASWLNGQRYLDDRKRWYRTTAEAGKNAATESHGGVKRGWLDVPADCPKCDGTGWKPVGSKVARCDCRLGQEKRDAPRTQTTE